MRMIYLVLVHSHPGQVQRLCRALAHEQARCLIHVDAKADRAAFEAALLGLDGVDLLPRRLCHAVNHAGFSQVEAILALIRESVRLYPQGQRFTLLTGSCYPVGSHRRLLALLEDPRDFLTLREVDREHPKFGWASRIWLLDHPLLSARTDGDTPDSRSLRHFVRVGLSRSGEVANPPVPLYAGPGFWSFRRESLITLLDQLGRQADLVEQFRYARSPDEMLFHTVCGRLGWARQLAPHFHYVRVNLEADLQRRRILDESHLPAILESGALFARKMDPSRSARLLEQIDVLRQEAPAATAAIAPPALVRS